jgi:hypothetical protein
VNYLVHIHTMLWQAAVAAADSADLAKQQFMAHIIDTHAVLLSYFATEHCFSYWCWNAAADRCLVHRARAGLTLAAQNAIDAYRQGKGQVQVQGQAQQAKQIAGQVQVQLQGNIQGQAQLAT